MSKMLTFQLPEETVGQLINALDKVGGTRQLSNFFESGLIKAKKEAELEAVPNAEDPQPKKEPKLEKK